MTLLMGLDKGLGGVFYARPFKDELFMQSFGNTVKFVLIIVPLQCLGAPGLALLINKAAYCKKYFKAAFFVPAVMSPAVVSTLRMQIYMLRNGGECTGDTR